MNRPFTKCSFSQSQQRLVELCQRLNFGRIDGLHVRNGQPVFEPPPRIIQKLKMCGENSIRPEADLQDCWLKRQTIEMLQVIGDLADGVILSIDVKGGLPFAVDVELKTTPGDQSE